MCNSGGAQCSLSFAPDSCYGTVGSSCVHSCFTEIVSNAQAAVQHWQTNSRWTSCKSACHGENVQWTRGAGSIIVCWGFSIRTRRVLGIISKCRLEGRTQFTVSTISFWWKDLAQIQIWWLPCFHSQAQIFEWTFGSIITLRFIAFVRKIWQNNNMTSTMLPSGSKNIISATVSSPVFG